MATVKLYYLFDPANPQLGFGGFLNNPAANEDFRIQLSKNRRGPDDHVLYDELYYQEAKVFFDGENFEYQTQTPYIFGSDLVVGINGNLTGGTAQAFQSNLGDESFDMWGFSTSASALFEATRTTTTKAQFITFLKTILSGDDTIDLGGGEDDGDSEVRSLAEEEAIIAFFKSLGGNDEIINRVIRFENLIKGNFEDDELAGGIKNDTIRCFAGDDTATGGAGNDTIDGGEGSDELAGDAGDDNLSGENGDDILEGGDGKDTLWGDRGDDVVEGGSGSDDLFGMDGEDELSGGSSSDTVYGNEGKDVIAGDSGDDDLHGGAASDKLNGGSGNDYLNGGLSNTEDDFDFDGLDGKDTLTGGTGDDYITGGTEADKLYGGSGKDYLLGGDGNDRIDGGTGEDRLRGDGGRDVFVFDDIKDSLTGKASDFIEDFKVKIDDINLAGIDAIAKSKTDNDFDFIGKSAFHKVAGELRYYQINKSGTSNDLTFVQADTNGDGKADFQIELFGLKTMKEGDFIL